MATQHALNRIVQAVMDAAVATANRHRQPGESFTADDIAAVIAADPHGETARYVAEGIAAAIGWHEAMVRSPRLRELMRGAA